MQNLGKIFAALYAGSLPCHRPVGTPLTPVPPAGDRAVRQELDKIFCVVIRFSGRRRVAWLRFVLQSFQQLWKTLYTYFSAVQILLDICPTAFEIHRIQNIYSIKNFETAILKTTVVKFSRRTAEETHRQQTSRYHRSMPKSYRSGLWRVRQQNL